MAGGREFNPSKFYELVLLLAERSTGDPAMSRVKLNKLLYRADFEAFREHGHSITGATYIRGEFGPMAAELPFAEERLGERGYLSYTTDESGPYPRKIPTALSEADESQFSPEELAIIKSALEELAEYGGKGASEWSHEQSSGWQVRKNDKPIPYASAFVSTQPLSDAQMKRALQRSRDEDWASVRP